MKSMRAGLSLAVLAALCGSCDSIVGSGGGPRIGWGTSFNMCTGYCRQALYVTPDEIRLTQSPWTPGQGPERVSTLASDPALWAGLSALVDKSGIEWMQDVYGCPDCADGGAEWVEVHQPGRVKRVTFEYGSSPAGLGPVVTQLRGVRARFDPVPLASPTTNAAGRK